jgi:hypothetical protein
MRARLNCNASAMASGARCSTTRTYARSSADGKRYRVVSYALDDGDGRVRMSVAADDGAWSACVPLVRDQSMRPDGTFVE